MSNLKIFVQGTKGGPAREKEIGSVTACIDRPGDEIMVDAFSGYGETYMRRNNTLINVCKNDEVVFSGSFDELVEMIKNGQ